MHYTELNTEEMAFEGQENFDFTDPNNGDPKTIDDDPSGSDDEGVRPGGDSLPEEEEEDER